ILKKEQSFRKAFDNFDIKKVANYDEADRERLLADAGIIRNKLKVNAAIENAKTIIGLQETYGSFKNWINQHHPKTKDEWVKLFKKTFKFTGGEIVNEFLMSTGYLPGAHDLDCPTHQLILASKPAWQNEDTSA
ncbi:MAG: DNA-3-methyladenine glycosylase I, partial [Flavobacterium sp.]